LLALVRVKAPDPFHRKPTDPPADPQLRHQIVQALDRLDWEKLSDSQRLDLLRVYAVLFNRLGWPDRADRGRVIKRLDPHFPAKGRELNADLCQMLVYLEAPGVAARALKLLEDAPTQEEQIDFAKSLRMLETGWTPEQRRRYFSWFLKAGTFKGGASFTGFVANIKKDAVAALSDAEKANLKPVLEARPSQATDAAAKPRPFVKKWSLDELVPLVEKGLTRRDFDRGRSLFAAANCFGCHRFNNEGGASGPDLTAVSGRFSIRDLLESIVDPSKEISDQYAAVVIATTDGKVVTGRIVNAHGDNLSINTDMLNPSALVDVNRRRIESMATSKVSMMPVGLLDTLKDDEVLDLVAFLLSRGDRKLPMFQTISAAAPAVRQPAIRRPGLVSPEVHPDGSVTFRVRAPKAEKVTLGSGDIRAVLKDAPTALNKSDDGVWSLTLGPLPPGIYDYTFNVDGVVLTDPSSPHVFNNRQGSRGYVEVPGPKGQPRPDEWRDVPHGTVTIHWYDSRVSGTRRRLHVYTPPGYGKDRERKYPVLYLLHGGGDNDSHWMLLGQANVIADNLIADGKAVPMVIVMPDGHVRAQPAGTVDEKTRLEVRRAFERDLLEHVVPLVESTYRVRTDAAGRAVAGLSMGSAQALGVGLRHTDQFAWIGAFSGALTRNDPAVAGLQADPGRANERLKLLWLAIGKEDSGVQRKRDLDAALKEMGVRHEYHETEGAHRWSVWRHYLAEFLPRLFR
jgi:putative heme-binding domain-containing protein